MASVKLLHKTARMYVLCCVIVLVIAAPVFYFAMAHLYMADIDETLLLHKKEFQHEYAHLTQTQVRDWNTYNRNTKIEPDNPLIASDTLFYQNYFDTLDNEMEPYRVLQSPISIEGESYLYTSRASLVESEDLITSIAIVFVILITLLLTALLWITNRLSFKLWLPFRNTLNQLKSFDLTLEQTLPFESTQIEEFEDLHQSLHTLIDGNISVYKQQKTFIENASHELQTPLAVLKSKLDLLIQNQDITAEQYEMINAIQLPLSRVTRINKNLLLLAKIENNQFADTEEIDLNQLLAESLDLLSDYITAKHISVTQNLLESTRITCNKTLLEILISNLLINAIVHNKPDGSIHIELTGKTLTLSNTGEGPLNNTNLFKRFSVSSSQTASSGLGLSIVHEITNRYQWKIEYRYENNLHIFSITF